MPPASLPHSTPNLHITQGIRRTTMPPRAAAALTDSRLVALCRAVCATNPGIAAPFFAGHWTEDQIDRTASAAATLASEIGDIAPASIEPTAAAIATRLTRLLAEARPLQDGRNSLAEHLIGRAGRRPDRLQPVARPRMAD